MLAPTRAQHFISSHKAGHNGDPVNRYSKLARTEAQKHVKPQRQTMCASTQQTIILCWFTQIPALHQATQAGSSSKCTIRSYSMLAHTLAPHCIGPQNAINNCKRTASIHYMLAHTKAHTSRHQGRQQLNVHSQQLFKAGSHMILA